MGKIPFTMDWISMMVHDLKPPLSVLQQIVYDGPLEEGDKQLALMQLKILSGRTENLLFCAKRGASSYELSRQWVDLGSVAAEIVESLNCYPEIRASEVELSAEISDDSCDAFVNQDVIRRVIDNLLTNAIRFAHPEQGGRGHVSLTVKPGGLGVEIVVADDGPGIPKEFIDTIFLKFTQLKPVANTCGLGLAFVKMAVDAHGG
ncbi:MAG: sensor histidine kinase, partial [Nitrospinota bacterium]